MADQDLVIKVKAIIDDSLKRTFKEIEQMVSKTGMGGPSGPTSQAAQTNLIKYLKAMKEINGEFKIQGKDLKDLKKYQDDVNKQMDQELRLRKQLRKEINQTNDEVERNQKRQQMIESSQRSKYLDEQKMSARSMTSGGGDSKLSMMGRARAAMGRFGGPMGVGLSAAGMAADAYETFYGVSSEQRKASERGLQNQQFSAARSGKLSEGMFTLNKGAVKGSIGQGAVSQVTEIVKNLSTDVIGNILDLEFGKALSSFGTAGKNIIGFKSGVTQKAMESLSAKKEQYKPLLEEMDRYQGRALNNYDFMRQSGLEQYRDQIFSSNVTPEELKKMGAGPQLGLVGQFAKQYSMTEAESLQSIGGAVNALGGRRGMDIASSMGKYHRQGMSDIAPSLIAQQAAVGGVSAKDGDKKFQDLMSNALRDAMDDTVLAKNLSVAATTFQSAAVGQFGIGTSGQTSGFMNTAKLISERYGGEMSIENINRAAAIEQMVASKTTQSGGLEGLMNFGGIQKALPGSTLIEQKSLANMSLQALTKENISKSIGLDVSDEQLTGLRKSKLEMLFGAGEIGMGAKASGRQFIDKYLNTPEADRGKLEDEFKNYITKNKEGKQLGLAAGSGNLEMGYAALAGQLGFKSSLGTGTGTAPTAKTAEGDVKAAAAAQDLQSIINTETEQFKKVVSTVLKETQDGITATFNVITDNLKRLQEETGYVVPQDK